MTAVLIIMLGYTTIIHSRNIMGTWSRDCLCYQYASWTIDLKSMILCSFCWSYIFSWPTITVNLTDAYGQLALDWIFHILNNCLSMFRDNFIKRMWHPYDISVVIPFFNVKLCSLCMFRHSLHDFSWREETSSW